MPPLLMAAALFAGSLSACQAAPRIDVSERQAIADSLQRLVEQAYDFSRPDAAARLLSLYADSGRIISAAAGRVTTTRAALATEIAGFWERVGQNMRGPRFEFGSRYVDIITRDAALMTFTYRIPHRTPMETSHVVSGAWTTLWRRENGRWQIVQEHLSDTPESTAPGPTPPDTSHQHTPGMAMPGMIMPAPGRSDTLRDER
jgi:ketosteroid isomerase-like protein